MLREVSVVNGSDNVRIYTIETEFKYRDPVGTYASRNNKFRELIKDIPVLEVSTASMDRTGYGLSAFNLTLDGLALESVYHSTKVFLHKPNNSEVAYYSPTESKQWSKSVNDMLLGFELPTGESCTVSNAEFMYGYLYMQAVMQSGLFEASKKYQAFGDIYFNPEKSLACQAHAIAAMQVLDNRGVLAEALSSFTRYCECMNRIYLYI